MNTRALFVMVATGLAVSAGAAKAQELDALDSIIDLPSVADLILSELLEDEDSAFALSIGFSFGFSFSSGTVTIADTVAEGLVIGWPGGDAFGAVDTFVDSFAMPGFAATTAGVNTVIITFTPPPVNPQTSVSHD